MHFQKKADAKWVTVKTVKTNAKGVAKATVKAGKSVWRAVVEDFVTRAAPGGLRILINDCGARPDTVSLRLLQGARLMEDAP